jgi:RNA polymerase sigma-70 factor (ECF subfamily)
MYPIFNFGASVTSNHRMSHQETEILNLLKDPETRDRGFLLLMNTYQKQLYGHIRRMVQSHEDAEDILQETFILVYGHLDAFKGESKLYTWLYRIATNECNRHFRHKDFRIRKVDLDSGSASELEAETDVGTSEDVLRKFKKAILQLPKKQQAVFNLRYFDEMSYDDMAQVLRTSAGTLRTTYHFAFERIKKYVTEHD